MKPVVINVRQREISVKGRVIPTPRLEWRVLETLIKDGGVMAQVKLLEEAWDHDRDAALELDTRTVTQTVCRLRRRIHGELIITVPKFGYKIGKVHRLVR